MSNSVVQLDYRSSHMSPKKASSYDKSFTSVPFRAFVWRREQQVLDMIIRDHFAGVAIDHLDFACGTGRILSHLCGQTHSSTGVDVSRCMLDIARTRAPKAELLEADLTRENVLQHRKFNLITAFRFFPCAQDELRTDAIRMLADLLSEDGILVFNNHLCESGSLFRIARMLGKHPHTMRLTEAQELVRNSGLVIQERHAIGTLPATDHFMLLPEWVHRTCDKLAQVSNVALRLAQNIIFVCRHAPSPTDACPRAS